MGQRGRMGSAVAAPRRGELAGVSSRAAAMFCGFQSGERANEWGKRRLWCSGFRSARELVVRGAALLGPRRRRGGSREEVLGGVAKGGEVQREAKGGGGGAARRVGASTTQNVAGQTHHCASDLYSGGGEKQSKQAGWRWKKGLFCNFQNSRDPTVKQR